MQCETHPQYQFLLLKTRQVFRVNSLSSERRFPTNSYQWRNCWVREFWVNLRLLTKIDEVVLQCLRLICRGV
jgi:hypothetical protein